MPRDAVTAEGSLHGALDERQSIVDASEIRRRLHRSFESRKSCAVRPRTVALLTEDPNGVLKISDLEHVAISLAMQGQTKTQIARRMNLKVKSIAKLLSNANRKLADVSSKEKQ